MAARAARIHRTTSNHSGYITHNGDMSAATMAPELTAVDLLDYDLFADHEPWEVFEVLQREAPVYFHPEPEGRGFWALTKYDDVLAVLRDTKTYSSEIGGAATIEDLPEDVLAARRNFLEFDPPKHGRYRRLISSATSRRPRSRATRSGCASWSATGSTACCRRASSTSSHELAAPIPIRVLGAHPRPARGDPAPSDRRSATACSSTPTPSTSASSRSPASATRTATSRSARPGPTSCARSGAPSTPIAAPVPATTCSRLIANGEVDGRPLSDQRPRQHVRAADRGRERDDAAGDRAWRRSRSPSIPISAGACARIAR